MKVWVDHIVDHFSTYIYQKRGFYYFSRRVPKDVQPLHGKQRIVLALNARSRAKALKYSQVICQRLDERRLPIQLHMEPLVIQSLGYDLALSQGITELPCLQGHHDAGLWIM